MSAVGSLQDGRLDLDLFMAAMPVCHSWSGLCQGVFMPAICDCLCAGRVACVALCAITIQLMYTGKEL